MVAGPQGPHLTTALPPEKAHLLEDVLLIEESTVLWKENTHGGPLETLQLQSPTQQPWTQGRKVPTAPPHSPPEGKTANSSSFRRCFQKLLILAPCHLGPRILMHRWGGSGWYISEWGRN